MMTINFLNYIYNSFSFCFIIMNSVRIKRAGYEHISKDQETDRYDPSNVVFIAEFSDENDEKISFDSTSNSEDSYESADQLFIDTSDNIGKGQSEI